MADRGFGLTHGSRPGAGPYGTTLRGEPDAALADIRTALRKLTGASESERKAARAALLDVLNRHGPYVVGAIRVDDLDGLSWLNSQLLAIGENGFEPGMSQANLSFIAKLTPGELYLGQAGTLRATYEDLNPNGILDHPAVGFNVVMADKLKGRRIEGRWNFLYEGKERLSDGTLRPMEIEHASFMEPPTVSLAAIAKQLNLPAGAALKFEIVGDVPAAARQEIEGAVRAAFAGCKLTKIVQETGAEMLASARWQAFTMGKVTAIIQRDESTWTPAERALIRETAELLHDRSRQPPL